jgi:hypothetical protein
MLKKLPNDRGLHRRPKNFIEEVIAGRKEYIFGFNNGQ